MQLVTDEAKDQDVSLPPRWAKGQGIKEAHYSKKKLRKCWLSMRARVLNEGQRNNVVENGDFPTCPMSNVPSGKKQRCSRHHCKRAGVNSCLAGPGWARTSGGVGGHLSPIVCFHGWSTP
eukprot:scaffold35376_cov12-Tisochrysis_lutea.AAC.1